MSKIETKTRDVLREKKVPFINKVVHLQRYLFILTINRNQRMFRVNVNGNTLWHHTVQSS